MSVDAIFADLVSEESTVNPLQASYPAHDPIFHHLYDMAQKSGHLGLARELLPFVWVDNDELMSRLNVREPLDVDVDLLAANLDRIVLSDDFAACAVPSAVLAAIAAAGLQVPAIAANGAVHSRLADFALAHLAEDGGLAPIFGLVEFSRLRDSQIIEIVGPAKLSAIGLRNAPTVIRLLSDFQVTAANFLSEVEGEVRREVADELRRRSDEQAAAITRGIESQFRSYADQVRNLSEEIERLKATCDSALAAFDRREADRFRQEVSFGLQDGAAPRAIERLVGRVTGSSSSQPGAFSVL
jgi:hypothetical protein